MRLLVLGAGIAGVEVALRARALGWEVVATTTTPSRIPELEQIADRAVVLRGADRAAVAAAAEGCDAVLMAATPPAASEAAERRRTYEDVLVESCLSAVAACPRVVFLGSTSVYGDGTQEPGTVITEETARSTSDEPSRVFYSMAEDVVLGSPEGTVLRLPDFYGHPDDMDFAARLVMAHEVMGGSVPFAPDGRLHRVHVDDVAAAVVFALEHDLTGVFNVVPDLVPAPTNREAFDRLADAAGLTRLEFRGELGTPTQEVSSARLRDAGFTFTHPDDPIV